MILSDKSIREAVAKKRIVIEPFDSEMVKSFTYDVKIGHEFLVFQNTTHPYIDLQNPQDNLTRSVKVENGKPFILHPGEFVLGSLLENLELPSDIAAQIEGKSSLGRVGLLIHSTAGYVDPGWKGKLTLELSNVANLPITIYPGMPIGKLVFHELSTSSERPYGSPELGSKYHSFDKPVVSKIHLDLEKK